MDWYILDRSTRVSIPRVHVALYYTYMCDERIYLMTLSLPVVKDEKQVISWASPEVDRRIY